MLPMLLLAVTLYPMERARARRLSLMALLVGVAGMLGVALLQLLLILKVIPFEQEVGPVVVANGVIGLWLVLVNHMGRIQRIVPARVALAGNRDRRVLRVSAHRVLGLGGTLDWSNMMSNSLLLATSAVAFIGMYLGFPLWALWLGRVFSHNGFEFKRNGHRS